MPSLKEENFFQILFILSILILGTAFVIEYFFGYMPCNLCKIERIPYGLSIIILIVNYNFKGNQIFYSVLLMLVFSFSIIISIYHLGIEQGFFEESTVCAPKNLNLLTKEEVLKSLNELSISCKDVAFKVFGLSLTNYNIIMSVLMFLISTKIYSLSNDNKK
tara:strand:- start:112 stop:597 length:486 start_codon:yes stop_codon:yes gene_type:complete